MAIKGRCHEKKSLDSLEIPSRIGACDRFHVPNLDSGSLTDISDSNRREADESADSVLQLRRFRGMRDALVRLAKNPQDAWALIAVYDVFGNHLKASAVRWFGRDAELRRRVVLSILVTIGRNAGTYDARSMDAAEWVRHCAEAEARKLREALDAGGTGGRRSRRAI